MMGLAHGCGGCGNPNNGIVMVTGQAPSGDAGTLVQEKTGRYPLLMD